MATFFGGEELVRVLTFQQTFTPSNQQKFDIYTVPTGHHAIIKKYNLISTSTFEVPYYLVLQNRYENLSGSAPNPANMNTAQGNYKLPFASCRSSDYISGDGSVFAIQSINVAAQMGALKLQLDNNDFLRWDGADPSGDSTNIIGFKDMYMSATEKVRFESYTNTNTETNYFVEIHEFKNP